LGSIGATLSCLQDMPILLLQPLVSVLVKVVFLSAAGVGMAWVMSIGAVSNYEVHSAMPAGLARQFTYTDEQMWVVLGYVFLAAWMYEFICAVEQFVFIYAVHTWYHAPYTEGMIRKKSVSQLFAPKGLFLALTYYLGSMTFGSLLLAVTRMLYFVMSLVYKQAKSSGEDNNVAAAAAGCCLCCLKCWESLVRYLNKMVYTIVLANSTGFCSSAETMLEVVASEFVAMALLEGATKVFQATGLVTITGAGSYLTWLTLRHVEAFNSPTSVHFVPQPEYLTIAAGILSSVIGMVFMEVFDVVSDTTLLCWALDKKTRKERGMAPNPHTPDALKSLLEKTPGPAE